MAGSSDLIMIVLVVGGLWYLHSTGKLDEIMGGLNLGGGGGAPADVEAAPTEGGEEAYAEAPEGDNIDVSGPGSGACSNGRCRGDPAAIRHAQEMLEEIQR